MWPSRFPGGTHVASTGAGQSERASERGEETDCETGGCSRPRGLTRLLAAPCSPVTKPPLFSNKYNARARPLVRPEIPMARALPISAAFLFSQGRELWRRGAENEASGGCSRVRAPRKDLSEPLYPCSISGALSAVAAIRRHFRFASGPRRLGVAIPLLDYYVLLITAFTYF